MPRGKHSSSINTNLGHQSSSVMLDPLVQPGQQVRVHFIAVGFVQDLVTGARVQAVINIGQAVRLARALGLQFGVR